MSKHNYTLSEINIVYRPIRTLAKRPIVDEPDKAHRIFRENWDSLKIDIVEEFKIMLLNRANRVLRITPISLGGTAGTVVDPKINFVIALKTGSGGIIMAPNLPLENIVSGLQHLNITTKISLNCR